MKMSLVKVCRCLHFVLLFLFFSQSTVFSQNLPPSDFDTQQVPAFPGAEGFGKYTTGGRGGTVYIVTNLNDSGQGSLRWALEAREPRIVVFEVSGTIHLKSPIRVQHPNLTIAGQTAPGDGITIANYWLNFVNMNNLVVRFIRFRPGDTSSEESNAGFGVYMDQVIFDHCSFSWANDELASFYAVKNFTMQWSIFSEALHRSIHSKGAHGFGTIAGGKNVSWHHNLIAHANQRMTMLDHPGLYQNNNSEIIQLWRGITDFRNNVIYNWEFRSTSGGAEGEFNIINNYYKPGPATISSSRSFILNPLRTSDGNGGTFNYGKFFLNGNNLFGNSSVTNNNWIGATLENSSLTEQFLSSTRVSTAFPIPNDIYTRNYSANEAYQRVLNSAGASYARDAVDIRIINETRNGTFTFNGSKGSTGGIIDSQRDVGGWPTLKSLPAPKDTDRDGIPDEWEVANGLNPQVPNDKEYNLSPYYTDIEVYINSLVQELINEKDPGPPARVELRLPANSQTIVPTDISLAWRPISNAQTYTLQLSKSSDFSSGVITINNISNHSVVYPSLDPNSTYYWRVRGRNASGNGPYSLVGSFKTSTTNLIPERTILLSPSQNAGQIGLTPTFIWAKVPNAKAYRIQVSTTSDFSNLVINQSNVIDNHFTPSIPLQENRVYFWRVRASNDIGNGTNSLTGNFRTLSLNSTPSVIVAISPTNNVAINPRNIQLKWIENPSAERYQIQVALDTEFNNRVINEFNATGNEYLISNLNSNTKYYWRIRGINRSGSGSYSSLYEFTTRSFEERPSASQLIFPEDDSNIFSTSIQFSWEPDPVAQSYRFQLSTNPNFSSYITNVGGLTNTSRTINNLTANRDYYWRVQAINEAGVSEFSETRKVRAATFSGTPSATNLISPVNSSVVGSASILFSWENQPNTEFYRLEVSENSSFSSTVLIRNSIRGTSTSVEGLLPNKTYFWRIRTSNPAGIGQRSEIWSFRTVTGDINLYPTTLLAPKTAASIKTSEVNFSWEAVSEATAYHLQISEKSDFSTILFQNQSINTNAFTLNSLASGKAYFWRVRARNGAIFSAWSESWNFTIGSTDNLLNVGLVGYWPMEEGGGNRMMDQSGNNLHATIQDSRNVNWIEGQQGKAINLPGTTGRLGTVNHHPALNIPNAITLAAWIRPDQIQRGTIFSKNSGNGFELWLDNNGNIEFRLNRGNNGTNYRLVSNFNYANQINKWIHVAATFDGRTSIIYINGEEDISRTYNPFTIGTNSGNLTIGSLGDIQRWRGDLDELRIYNRALNKSEINLLTGLTPPQNTNNPTNTSGLIGHWKMDEGSGGQLIDHSGNQLHAYLLNPSGFIWTQGVIGQAVVFPGTSDRFGIVSHHPKLSIPNALTIASWVNPSNISRNTIIYKADGNGFELWLDHNGFIEFRLNRGNNGTAYRILSRFNYSQSVGKWFHVTATFDGSSSKIFINGIEDNSAKYPPFGIGTKSGDLMIGALGTIQRFNGNMDDLRLFDRALTTQEIQHLINPALNQRNSEVMIADYFEGLQLGLKYEEFSSIIQETFEKPTLYPNPTEKELTVTKLWIQEGILDVTISDVKGSIILNRKVSVLDGVLNLNLNHLNLKPGYYMFILQDNINKEVLRFIKK